MFNFKKIGILFSTGLILAACTNNNGESSSANETDGGVTEISYAMWDAAQKDIYEELAREFEAQNDNIKVKIEVTPWDQYWTKVEAAITGGSVADVFWLNIPNSTDYIDAGVVSSLSEFDINVDNIPQQYIEAFQRDGVLYGVPKDFDTQALWYNKEVFDKAGVDYPDETWTWDDWYNAAKEITDEENGIYGVVAPLNYQGGYHDMIYQNGGTIFSEDGTKSNMNSPEAIEALEFYKKFIDDGLSPSLEVMAGTETFQLFNSGKIGTIIGGSWMTGTYLKDNEYGLKNFDIAPLPMKERRATTSNSIANVIAESSKNKEAAAKFIQFLNSKEANLKVAQSGVVIPAAEGTQEPWVNSYPEHNLQVFVDAVEYAIPLPYNKNGQAANESEVKYLNKAWTGEMSIEEAVNEFVEYANSILAR